MARPAELYSLLAPEVERAAQGILATGNHKGDLKQDFSDRLFIVVSVILVIMNTTLLSALATLVIGAVLITALGVWLEHRQDPD